MGRGRAKAKQTKVARELKYSSPSTDFASLQRELANGGSLPSTNRVIEDDAYTAPSQWDDDYDDWKPSR